MPVCLRCGWNLVESELNVTNWTGVAKKVFYSCTHCGATWLYSKDLNCPVLIHAKNIIRQPREHGASAPQRRARGILPKSSRPRDGGRK